MTNCNSHHSLKHLTAKEEWEKFWSLARMLSEKKISKLKPKKEEEAQNALRHWMQLYYRRWDSIFDYQNFTFASTPDGGWDRVGEHGMSDNGDCVYEATNYHGKHGCPLSNDWVLEKSVPDIQRIGHGHYEDSVLPILQILRIIIPGNGRVGLGLSDGDFLVMGTLHNKLDYLIKNLQEFTIVKLEDYHIEYNPVPVIHIRSMLIWNDVINERIRAPKPIASYRQVPQYASSTNA